MRVAEFRDDDGAVHAVTLGDGDADSPAGPVAVDADGAVWVHARTGAQRLRPLTRREATLLRLEQKGAAATTHVPEVRAPMPGAVTAIHAGDGEPVEEGDRILTIEAMKMEHPVLAPFAGTVHLRAAVGDQIRRDQIIALVRSAHEEPGDGGEHG